MDKLNAGIQDITSKINILEQNRNNTKARCEIFKEKAKEQHKLGNKRKTMAYLKRKLHRAILEQLLRIMTLFAMELTTLIQDI